MTENKRTRRIWIRSVRRDPPDIPLIGRAFIGAVADEAQKAAEQAQLKDEAQPHQEDAS